MVVVVVVGGAAEAALTIAQALNLNSSQGLLGDFRRVLLREHGAAAKVAGLSRLTCFVTAAMRIRDFFRAS